MNLKNIILGQKATPKSAYFLSVYVVLSAIVELLGEG